MNHSEREIESLLSDAPRPRPPEGLESQLAKGVEIASKRRETESMLSESPTAGWLRRWWPAVALGVASVACAAVIAHQQIEINKLRESIRQVRNQASVPVVAPESDSNSQSSTQTNAAGEYQEEIDRLRTEAQTLRKEVSTLENTRAENEQLQTQLAAPLPASLPPGFQEAQEVMEKARSIQCVNNLKQFGLAVRVWALDNGGRFPPNVLSMSNELSAPKILVCPSDTSHEPASNWASFTTSNLSYDYLAPDGSDLDPQRVLSRCRLHGNIGLCDGSVQMLGTNYANRVVQREGKLYMK